MILAHTLTGRLPLNEFEDLMGLNNPEKRAYKHLDPEQVIRFKKVYQDDWGVEQPLILDPFSGVAAFPLNP